jgi:HPt (histidine-containing phosphotransfer) domain-containing protein
VSKELALPGPDVPVIDETRLLEEFGGDQEILNELRDLFLEHVPPLYSDIEQACQTGDDETFAISIHSLKGACATYGAPRLAMVCKEMEAWARSGDMESVKGAFEHLSREYQMVFEQIKGVGVGV